MLAQFKRDRRPFEYTFGRPAQEVISAMDAANADVANQRPHRPLKLTTVGIEPVDIPVTVRDPLDRRLTHQLRCNIRISVSLDAFRRGIHVSRMCNDLASIASEALHDDLLAFTEDAARRIAETQGAESCFVQAKGVYTFMEPVEGWTPAKDKVSIEALPLLAETHFSALNGKSLHAGFQFSHITACPCVQGMVHTLRRLKGAGTTDLPPLTHSQRCKTTVLLRDVKRYPELASVLRVFDRCATRTQNTLPREYELALVHAAHVAAFFLEDVVRECGYQFHDSFRSLLEPTGEVSVSSVSEESIHSFNLHAEARVPCSSDLPGAAAAIEVAPRGAEVVQA